MLQEKYTFCHICVQGCGMAVTLGDDGKIVEIRPDKDNPYAWRDFSVKGATAHEMNVPLAGARWLSPLIRFSRYLGRIKKDSYFSFSPRFIAWNLVRKVASMSWKDIMKAPHGIVRKSERFGNFWQNIRAADGKVNLCPDKFLAALQEKLNDPLERVDKDIYPLQLIGRRRKQMMNSWTVETTGQKLDPHTGHMVEINQVDCAFFNVKDEEDVYVTSSTGRVKARVKMSDKIRPGVAVMEQGWGSGWYSPHDNAGPIVRGVNRNRLVSNADLDRFSGVPRLNGTPITIVPVKDSPGPA